MAMPARITPGPIIRRARRRLNFGGSATAPPPKWATFPDLETPSQCWWQAPYWKHYGSQSLVAWTSQICHLYPNSYQSVPCKELAREPILVPAQELRFSEEILTTSDSISAMVALLQAVYFGSVDR